MSGLQEAPDRAVFVGRETELAELRAGLDRAFGRRGSVFLLRGEPGIGKTRIAEQIAFDAEERGVAVHWGRATQAEGVPPYWTWLHVLRSILSGIGAEEFARLAGSDLPQILQVFPELRRYFPSASFAAQDDTSRFRTYDAIAQLLLGVAADRPVLLVLEDLHWADTPSLILLQQVAAALSRSALVVIGTYRDIELGSDHPLRARIAVTADISLAGLDDSDAATLVRHVTAFEPAAELVERLQAQTAGNPLLLTELAKTFRDDAQAVPGGVASILERRILALSKECRDALAVAAAAGSEVDLDLMAVAMDCPRAALLNRLDEAAGAGVLTRRERGFAFAHGLFRDTVYAGLTTAHRAELHGLLARALEHRRHRSSAQLAHHFLVAASADEALHEKALDYALRAGADAFAELAYEESVKHFEVAVGLADSVEPARRAELLLDVGRARYMAGDPGGAIAAALEASRIGERLGNSEILARAALVAPEVGGPGLTAGIKTLCDAALRRPPSDLALRVRLLSQMTVTLMQTIEPDAAERAQDYSREAMQLAEQTADPDVHFAAIHARQMATSGPDGVDERLELAQQTLALGRETGCLAYTHWGHSWRADALVQLGRIDEAEIEIAEQARTAEMLKEPLARWRALIGQSWIALVRGRFDLAHRLSEEARELGRGGDHPIAEFQHLTHSLWLELLTGDVRDDGAQVDAFLRRFPAMSAPITVWRVLKLASAGRASEARTMLRPLSAIPPSNIRPLTAWLPAIATTGQAVVAVGDAQAAERLYQALLPYSGYVITTGAGMASVLGAAARYLAQLAATLERWDEAVTHYETAVAVDKGMGAPPLVVCSQVLYAELLVARGSDLRKARKLAESALAIAQELGMRPWSERAKAILHATAGGDQPLSRRELEVAELVSQGLSNRSIAECLHLSERTAESHVKNICDKLGFNSRSQVAAWVAARRSRTEVP